MSNGSINNKDPQEVDNGRLFREIADRLKQAVGLKKDAELARALGLTPTAYNNRKLAGSIPFEAICRLCMERNISVDAVLGMGTDAWTLTDAGERALLEAVRKIEGEDRRAVLRHALGLGRLPEP